MDRKLKRSVQGEFIGIYVCLHACLHMRMCLSACVGVTELFSPGSAGLCWHAAARYFQGEQLRKCPWHVLCIMQHTVLQRA